MNFFKSLSIPHRALGRTFFLGTGSMFLSFQVSYGQRGFMNKIITGAMGLILCLNPFVAPVSPFFDGSKV